MSKSTNLNLIASQYHENSEENSQHFVNIAISKGLTVIADAPTPADGNCFYHAIIQQLQRPEIRNRIDQSFYKFNNHTLRQQTVCFVRRNMNTIPYFRIFHDYFFPIIHSNITWDAFLQNQEKNSEYATELFIVAMAYQLRIFILVNSEQCTPAQPYNTLPGYQTWNTQPNVHTSILIGCSNNHFQSLIPIRSSIPCITGVNITHDIINDHDYTYQNKKNVLEKKNITKFKTQKLAGEFEKNLSTTLDSQIPNDHDYSFQPKKKKQEDELIDFTVTTSMPIKLKNYVSPKKNIKLKNNVNKSRSSKKDISVKNIVSPKKEKKEQEIKLSKDSKELHPNPMVTEAMINFERGEMMHTIKSCVVCKEVRPIFHNTEPLSKQCNKNQGRPIPVIPSKFFKDGACAKCHNERLTNKRKGIIKAAKFSGVFSIDIDLGPKQNVIRHNGMHFLPVPPYLMNLSTVEMALISRITVIMNVHLLRYGMLASKGHCISLPHNMQVATSLPLLPSEVGIVVLKRKNSDLKTKQYTVQRHVVQNALIGLCFGYPTGGLLSQIENYKRYDGPDHITKKLKGRFFKYFPNQFYFDVKIENDRLLKLPDVRQQLPGLNVIECPEMGDEQDKGPAEEQFIINSDPLEDESITRSGFVFPSKSRNPDEDLKKVLDKLIGKEGSVEDLIQERKIAFTDWKYADNDPISELKYPGFFSMAFPTIFINGSCDITTDRLVSINFDNFVEHIYYTGDSRVAKHPYLKFFLHNLSLRLKALSQGAFVVSQQLTDAHLTIAELKQNIDNDDDSVPRKVISVGANLTNTDPFWRERKRELEGLTTFRKTDFGDISTYFDTNSIAEYHWVPLIKLLVEYKAATDNMSETEIEESLKESPHLLRKILLDSLHIVTNYFDARTKNYYATVVKELFQYDDIWWRYEFAKSRGEIHSHCIINSLLHNDKIKEAIIQNNETGVTYDAEKLQKWLQTNEKNDDNCFSPGFVSMHPAGGILEVNNNDSDWIPNKFLWAAPEGTQPPPDLNPLSSNFENKINDDELLKEYHISLVNRVGLHKCNGYCLYRKKVKSVDGEYVTKKYCRFGYGYEAEGDNKTIGKEIHPFHPYVTPGKHPKYEGPRDHPRHLMHSKMRPMSWKANCDTQPIIDQNLIALQKYIAGYACKGASTTEDYVQVYKQLLTSSCETATMKNVSQRLLMKIVGKIDVPGAAADYINSGGQLTHCSRKFRRIGLSGYRLLQKQKQADGKVTKPTPLEQYLSDTRRSTHPNITLWDWAKKCNCRTKCTSDHVPVFTGVPVMPVWPLTDKYCKGQLMIHSKGTWKNIDELKSNHNNFLTAFAEFLESDECPKALKETLSYAKSDYDEKIRKKYSHSKNPSNDKNNDEDVFNSQSTNCDSQLSEMTDICLGGALLRDYAKQNEENINNPVLEQILPNGGPGFNWNQHALESLTYQWHTDTSSWLRNIALFAEKEQIAFSKSCTLNKVNLLQANPLQRVIIAINIEKMLLLAKGNESCNSKPLRLLIQGTAGTGKTYVISALTYISRRIFKRNSSVMNLAPTGAAAILLPDGRTVHSVTPPPRQTKKKKDAPSVELSDYPLSDKNLKKLRMLTGSLNDTSNTNSIHLKCLNLDERGMFSKKLLAWCSERFREATNDLINFFGAIAIVNFSGDLGQLGPIGATDLHVMPFKSDAPDTQAGYAIYRSFDKCVLLKETMRQKPDQAKLLERLLRIRNGTIIQQDWIDINSRYEKQLPNDQQANFSHNKVITVMETWAEVNAENHAKLSILEKPVAVIPSKGSGFHHSSSEKQLGQIVSTCLLAVGCQVILTKNQIGLTGLGLNNGAMGTVIAILYEPNTKPPDFPIAVVVDFPNYRGPKWDTNNPTWVPIPVDEGRCDSNCCSRNGFPLMPGYAIPIAKSQGMSIGKGKPATHMRVKLQDSKGMEQLSLGTTYTAFSRCETENNWCLVEKIPEERLMYINNHPHMESRKKEEKYLQKLSDETVKEYQHYADNFEIYQNLIQQLDEFCDDGIFDSVIHH